MNPKMIGEIQTIKNRFFVWISRISKESGKSKLKNSEIQTKKQFFYSLDFGDFIYLDFAN
jgi:hypothetical protein